MKKIIAGMCACIILCCAGMVCATSVQINPDKLSPQDVQTLYALKKAQDNPEGAVDKVVSALPEVEKWPIIGQSIAKTIGATCRELNMEVNLFMSSSAGQLAMWLIIYKVVVIGALHSMALTAVWATILIMCWRMYRYFWGSERIKHGEDITYIRKFTFRSPEASVAAAVMLTIVTCIMTIIWMAYV